MGLSPGRKLGPYEIIAPLGAGGMGEVYRARDTRLKREVALKVLPDSFTADPDRMARFQREAEVLASLNHPNIAQIYAVEERALVMELVPGATLKGPLPVATALNYARQIAEALEAAHEKGIVHRDLKPGNIIVTPEGGVKVLDFGLAAVAQDPAPGRADPANSPTLTMRATEAGMIMGTAAYMSPEQASGRPVDKRSDIWSFGVVLWEMLTGSQLFDGETVSHTLADVLRGPIDFEKLPKETPSRIRELLKRCLDRDVKNRLRDIGEARVVIGRFLADPESGQLPQAAGPSHKLPWAIAALTTLAAIGLGLVAYRHTREQVPPVVKMSVLPPDGTVFPLHDAVPALSPDGRHLAFVITIDGKTSLWVRDLDSLDARPLAGTEEAASLFWSPDGRFIGFAAKNNLLKIELQGGPPVTICSNVPPVRGGTWGQSGVIVFGTNTGGLFRVPATGGTPVPLTTPDKSVHERAHFYPWFLPDGRHFLYSSRTEAIEQGAVYFADIDAKDEARSRRKVLDVNSEAMYDPSGYLLFLRERTLMAQPFDASRGETTGEGVPVAQQVDHPGGSISGTFTVSQGGALAYVSGVRDSSEQVSWFDRSGKEIGKAGAPGGYGNVRLSPDEKRIAFERNDAQSRIPDIWVTDLNRGVASRLTFDPYQDVFPLWSPDGLRIVYSNNRSGSWDLYIKDSAGAGQEEMLLKLGARNLWATSWSKDGRFVMYAVGGPAEKTLFDLWIAPQFGDRKPYPYLQTQFNEVDGVFSPDGRWVAYSSDESGRYEIYVQAFPLSGVKFQVSTGGGSEPSWRKDGAELFFQAADQNIMAVPVKCGARLEAGAPKPLFRTSFPALRPRRVSYAVSNDGQSFLAASGVRDEKAPRITVVLNWQAGLKK